MLKRTKKEPFQALSKWRRRYKVEKEIELELPRGEKPKEGKTEMAEKTVELMSGSPLEMKLEEVLGKVTAMESAMTKMTALFEGGAFSGKAGKE